MLRRLEPLYTYEVRAWDGPVGTVHDFLFDDLEWKLRYLVVETAEWLSGRRVLLVPDALQTAHGEEKVLPINLSREQVANSPPLETEQPVSRQYQVALHTHYEWPFYWTNLSPLGTAPAALPLDEPEAPAATEVEAESDEHLRSVRVVTGYDLAARDGEIGHLKDFIVNDENWAIFYMLIDTSSWLLPGKQVILPPTWVTQIDWDTGDIVVDLNRQAIRNSPEFDPDELVDRAYEERLYQYYERPGYW